MKKIAAPILVLIIVCLLSSLVFAYDNISDNDFMFKNISDHPPVQSNISTGITCNASKFIDPTSSNTRKQFAIINYNITPNDFKGTIVPEISNKKNNYTLNPVNVTGSNGSFTWNGEVDNKQINEAGNPYNITLILKDENGVEVATSSPNQIFVGRPVVVLHGLFQVSQDQEESKLYKHLSESYYTKSVEYLPPGYDSKVGSGLGDIMSYSLKLKYEIQDIKESTGAEKVDIVGYSMGGLVARWYYQELEGSKSTGKLIMLGTPNHGAEIANLVDMGLISKDSSHTAVYQMGPHSEFLNKLNENNNCEYSETSPLDSVGTTYITLACKDHYTWSHIHIWGYKIPMLTDGDLIVPYSSVRLSNVYNQDIPATHINQPENDMVTSQLETIIGNNDRLYSNQAFTG